MAFNLAKMLGLEAKRPDVPATPKIESFIPQQATDIQNQIYGLGQSYLSPGYEQSMFNRMKELMSPEFDRQMSEQQQNIATSGIEGTASSALLGKLRSDYLNDLVGKSFDVAQAGKQYGASLLDNIRQSLTSQGTSNYNQAVNDRNTLMGFDANAKAQTSSNMASLGSVLGTLGMQFIPKPAQTLKMITPTYDTSTKDNSMWDSFLRGGR